MLATAEVSTSSEEQYMDRLQLIIHSLFLVLHNLQLVDRRESILLWRRLVRNLEQGTHSCQKIALPDNQYIDLSVRKDDKHLVLDISRFGLPFNRFYMAMEASKDHYDWTTRICRMQYQIRIPLAD